MSDKEGQRLLKEGRKALKGGWFSSPDPETAARRFDAAANEFRRLGAPGRRSYIEALEAAAGAYAAIDAFQSAAKALETAAVQLEKEEKQPERAAELLQQAALHHRSNNHPDKAAADLVKAGRAVGEGDMALAVEYFDQAVAVFEDEGRARFSNDTIKMIQTFLLSHDAVEEALAVMLRQNALYLDAVDTFERYLYKNYLSVVVLLFHLGRHAEAAAKVAEFQTSVNFTVSAECEVANAMLAAYRAADQEKLDEARARPQVQHLDNRVARLGARLTFGDNVKAEAAALAETEALAELEDDDEVDFT